MVLLLLFTTSQEVNAHDAFSGFYSGVSAGGAFYSGQEDNLFQHIQPNTGQNVSSFEVPSKHYLRKNSFMAAAFLGYGDYLCWNDTKNIYLGIETFIDVANRDTHTFESAMNQDNGNTIFSLSSRTRINPFSYGIDLRPGYKFTECTLFFARLGVGFNTITISGQVTDTFSQGQTRTTIINAPSKTFTRMVLRMGLGLEQELCECLTLRADYIYTYFGKGTLEDSASGINAGVQATANNRTEVNILSHAVMLGLSWHW